MKEKDSVTRLASRRSYVLPGLACVLALAIVILGCGGGGAAVAGTNTTGSTGSSTTTGTTSTTGTTGSTATTGTTATTTATGTGTTTGSTTGTTTSTTTSSTTGTSTGTTTGTTDGSTTGSTSTTTTGTTGTTAGTSGSTSGTTTGTSTGTTGTTTGTSGSTTGTNGNEGLENSSWPKYQGNVQNTGLTIAFNNGGSLKWKSSRLSTGGVTSSASPVVAADGTAFVFPDNGVLYAFTNAGTAMWQYNSLWSTTRCTPTLRIDNVILLISRSSWQAVRKSGSQLWKTEYGSNAHYGSVTVTPSLNALSGFMAGIMVMSSSGQMVRTLQTSKVENDIALDRNGMAYYSPVDGGLRCFDSSNGLGKWNYYERANDFIVPFSSPSVDADGTVYVGSTSGTLHAVTGNLSNGTSVAKWKYQADSPIRSSPSIASDGSIVFTTDSGKIYCVDSNGSLKWTFSTGGKISAPVVISSNGVCYVGSQDGFFYAITMNGSQLWQYNANSPIYGGAAVSGDGLIYFVSYDGYLHCLQ